MVYKSTDFPKNSKSYFIKTSIETFKIRITIHKTYHPICKHREKELYVIPIIRHPHIHFVFCVLHIYVGKGMYLVYSRLYTSHHSQWHSWSAFLRQNTKIPWCIGRTFGWAKSWGLLGICRVSTGNYSKYIYLEYIVLGLKCFPWND